MQGDIPMIWFEAQFYSHFGFAWFRMWSTVRESPWLNTI